MEPSTAEVFEAALALSDDDRAKLAEKLVESLDGPLDPDAELCVLNDDGMTDDERRRLHTSISRGIRDGHAGREMDLDSFMDQLDVEP